MIDWGKMSRAERDAAYNNSTAVANSPALNAARIEASAACRAAWPGKLDLPYGPKERQKWDLFPAADPAAPCFVFIHGGYWQRNRREEFVCLGEGLRAYGWSVALPGYTLAPEASLAEIHGEIMAALDWLAANGAAHGITGPVLLSGWSAGGHLTAMCLNHPRVTAGLAISGLYELGPMRDTYLNEALRLTDAEVVALLPAPPAPRRETAGDHLRHRRAATAGRRQPGPARPALGRPPARFADPRTRRRPLHHRGGVAPPRRPVGPRRPRGPALMHDFTGQGVIITGALGIYGTWIAKAFARAGAKLCLTDRDPAALTQWLTDAAAPEGSFAHAGDLADDAFVASLVAGIGERWGAADVLVNNAGVYPSGFLLDIDAAEWDRILGINLRVPFLLTQAVTKQMIAAGKHGSVVNISSGAAHKMRTSVGPYCLSKTALDRLTKGLRARACPLRHPGERRRARLRPRQHREPARGRARAPDRRQHPARPRVRPRGRGGRCAVPMLARRLLHHRHVDRRRRRELDRLDGGVSGEEGPAVRTRLSPMP